MAFSRIILIIQLFLACAMVPAMATPAVEVPPPAFTLSEKNSQLDSPCSPGTENRMSDLCAQWKAADAAQEASDWSFRFGLAGVFIGFCTLVAAGMAAVYAKHAAAHTQRGADAAEAGVKEAGRIGEAQTRAYLSVDKIHIVIRRNGDANFVIHLVNSGSSPALTVSTVFSYIIGHDQVHEPIGKTDLVRVSSNISSGGEKVVLYSHPLGIIKPRGRTFIHVQCKTRYSTIFDDDLRTFSSVGYLELLEFPPRIDAEIEFMLLTDGDESYTRTASRFKSSGSE